MSKLKFIIGILCLLFMVGLGQDAYASGKLEIEDENNVIWKVNQDFPLFGEPEANGDTLLYPTKDGSFRFTIKNISNVRQDYRIKMATEDQHNIPIEYAIYRNNALIFGSETNYQELNETLSHDRSLATGQTDNYEIRWQWDGYVSDPRDTDLGIQAQDEDLYYKFIITVLNEEGISGGGGNIPLMQVPNTDGGSGSQTNRDSGILRYLPKTGEALQYWWVYTGFLLIGIVLIIKRKRKEETNE